MTSLRRFALALFLTGALSAPALAEKETFKFDPAHTEVGFRIRHIVTKVPGAFRKFDGTIEIDRAKPSESRVELKIDASSIDTGVSDRDKHLKSPDFFDVAKYPDITFKSAKITEKGKGVFEVAGELTMHGVTNPVVLTVTHLGFAKMKNGEKAGFEVAGKLNRKDFGVVYNRALDQGGLMLGEDIELSINVEAQKPAPAPPPSAAPAK